MDIQNYFWSEKTVFG